jgi:tetratricopeptide (TPR) repeat protein
MISLRNNAPILIIVGLLCASCSRPSYERDHQLERLIEQAKSLNDYSTAITATHELLSNDTNEISYYDSLARYYFRAGQFSSSLRTCKTYLEFVTQDSILFIAFRSAIALNRLQDVEMYALALVSAHPESAEYRFELCKAYFNLNKTYECQQALQDLLLLPSSKLETTNVVVNGVQYVVPIYTSANNMMGVLLANSGNTGDAIPFLQEAIRFSSDFPLPKQNLMQIRSK